MQKINKLEKIVFYGSLLFLFLVFLNFRDIPNRYAILGATVIYLFYVFYNKKTQLSVDALILGTSLFTFGLLAKYSIGNVVVTAIYPTIFFLLAKSLIDTLDNKKYEKGIYLIFLTFLFGYSLHGLLNCGHCFIFGLPWPDTRYWYDVWSGAYLPATQHSIYVLPMLALMIPAVIYCKKYKAVCSVILIVGVFFIVQSIDVLSRTPIMVFAGIAAWELVLFLFFNRNNSKIMKIFKWVFLLGCLSVVVFVIVSWDWLAELSFIQTLERDGGIFNNIRFRAQRSVLMQMFDYPMGGINEMYTEGLVYVHNVWLDMAKRTGLIPFSLFVIYTGYSLWSLFRLLRSNASREMKYALSGVYFAFVLYYSVEPALDANIQYMIPWTFTNGMIAKLGENKNESI